MALSDFNIFKQDASMIVAISTVSPILGNGSLRLATFDTGQRANGIRNVAPRQFTSGRARWLFIKRVNPGAGGDRIGFLFNTSQEDFSVASGPTAYFCCLTCTGATDAQFQMFRVNSGLPSLTNLGPTNTFSLAVNAVISLEVRWEISIAEFGGIQFKMRRGTTTDFADLADETPGGTFIVTTSLLQTTVGEGPVIVAAGSSPGDYRIDQMQAVPLTLA